MTGDNGLHTDNDWFGRGTDCYLHQMYSSAITLLSKAIKLDDADGMNYYIRGLAFLELGRKEEARADFMKATELGVSVAKTYLDASMSNPD